MNTIRSILKSENKYKDIDNSEFKKISADFKKKLSSKECIYHKLLPDAFALVKEAAKRTLGLNIYKTQLLCGIKLSKGYIAEMKTGEGKTLAAVAPAYLYALLGKCHIVTVNDYLAKTNSEQMSKVFSLLGLTTGCITAGLAPYERKRQYNCDIIYGTNQEFCFDYLRDNLRVAKDKIQTSLDYAIIDEIDSILIDDARTPLIISSEKELNNEMLLKADKFVKTLSEGKKIRKKLIYKVLNTTSSLDMLYTGDYVINRNNNTIFLTEKGIIKAEEYFGLDYYASEENIPLIGAISNALRANYMFEKDKDYVVSIDTVDIVDPSTGRIMIDRKYSDGLHQALEAKENQMSEEELEAIGAGDQGMMFGYATNETEEYMPYPISLAHKLAQQLTKVRKDGTLTYLRPDGKSQVSVEYDENNKPVRLEAVVLSTQHDPDVTQEQIHEDIKKYVFDPILPAELIDENTKFFINPTGRFVIGGPHGDAGLTGRKIIVDTYGGYARHGGGAFSGKDCTKVDRSAAYAARYVAKNIVAAGLADKCEIQLSYAIGVAQPTSIMADTFGTGKVSDEKLVEIIRENFDLRPAGIIKMLNLRRPIYKQTAAYGHFGRNDLDLPWEKLDKAEDLKKYL